MKIFQRAVTRDVQVVYSKGSVDGHVTSFLASC
jgi:hypothetical protein